MSQKDGGNAAKMKFALGPVPTDFPPAEANADSPRQPAQCSPPCASTMAAPTFVTLTVAVILWLVNRKDIMGRYRAGYLLNVLLSAAFIFSVAVAYVGAKTLAERFSQ